jgi:cytochrome c556
MNAMRKLVLGIVVAAAGFGAVAASAQDAAKIVQDRQDMMKQQGKDMEAVKAYLDGKGELPAAQTGGSELAKSVAKIPAAFPAGTGMEQFPGKSYAKAAIWSDPSKFIATAQTAQAKADALSAALKGGDKAVITAAFGDMGKNGCGGCHSVFREKKT